MLKLHYFDLYGRGEPIRMLLNYAKVDFEDCRYKFEEWPKLKAEGGFEFAQMPVLEVKTGETTKQYCQTLSILRYLGRKYSLYPADIEDAWTVDSTLDAIIDIINGLAKIHWEADEERKKKMAGELIGGAYPVFLKAMAARLDASNARGGRFILDDKVNAADILFACFIFNYIYNDLNPDSGAALKPAFEGYETLKKYSESLRAELGAYLESRPKSGR
ncbi:hypothetical protein FGO68_gene691 [Halteria grandinella]|uniref:Glutathione S-transferase n=1 Tax=Halteria grandinella TaxID=5974 RepID=A0A8J8SYS8_HALGN|nr:hypothetical protein FGO68_gene691 [Halteria grandinella]